LKPTGTAKKPPNMSKTPKNKKPNVRLGTQTTVRHTKITKINPKPATVGEKTILKYYCGIETTLRS